MRFLSILTIIAVAGAQSAFAQTTPPSTNPLSDRLRAVMGIPTRTAEAREAGVPDSSLKRVVDLLRTNNAEPQEIEEVLTTERDAAREHGPTDNFGAFVQAQLAAGKRGRELSAAIRAEHQAHGKGKGHGRGGQGEEHGQGNADDDHGRPQGDRGTGRQKPPRDSAATDRPVTAPSQGQGQSGRGRRPN